MDNGSGLPSLKTWRKVSRPRTNGERRQTLRGIDLHIDLAPRSAFSYVGGSVTQQILILELYCDPSTNVVELIRRIREESPAARGLDQILDRCAPERTSDEAYGINLGIMMPRELPEVRKSITAIVVLTIADDQKSFLCISGALDLFQSHMDSIE